MYCYPSFVQSNTEYLHIPSKDIINHKELINTWVTVRLVNDTTYSMYIREINDMGISGFLYLGLVPEYMTPGHTWPILADSFILYDYIAELIVPKV
jgi:hypothetical protein